MPWVAILKILGPIAAFVGIEKAWETLFGEALSPEDAKELQREVDRVNQERDVQTQLRESGEAKNAAQIQQAKDLRTGEMRMEFAGEQRDMGLAAQTSMDQQRAGLMTSSGQFDGWSKPFNWETILNMGR